MRFAKIYACMALLSLIVIYAGGCFTQLELNPLKWVEGARLACVIAYVGISVVNIIPSMVINDGMDWGR